MNSSLGVSYILSGKYFTYYTSAINRDNCDDTKLFADTVILSAVIALDRYFLTSSVFLLHRRLYNEFSHRAAL